LRHAACKGWQREEKRKIRGAVPVGVMAERRQEERSKKGRWNCGKKKKQEAEYPLWRKKRKNLNVGGREWRRVRQSRKNLRPTEKPPS